MQIKLSSTKRKEHLVHRLKHVIELAPESPPSKTTRSLDLSRVRRNFQEMSGRQTDKKFFFQKHFIKGFLLLQDSSLPSRTIKNAIKSL